MPMLRILTWCLIPFAPSPMYVPMRSFSSPQNASDERFVMDLKMVFDSFDVDKGGTVDRRELRSMLKVRRNLSPDLNK